MYVSKSHRTETKTDIPKKAHGEVAAGKAQKQAEKAKDEDDGKDQTSGAARDCQDQNETSGQTRARAERR